MSKEYGDIFDRGPLRRLPSGGLSRPPEQVPPAAKLAIHDFLTHLARQTYKAGGIPWTHKQVMETTVGDLLEHLYPNGIILRVELAPRAKSGEPIYPKSLPKPKAPGKG